MLTAEDVLGGHPFAMYLGDNLLRDGITELVESFRHDEHDALLLLTKVPDPWHYGVAELDGERIVRLVEKRRTRPRTWRWWACTCSGRRSSTPPVRSPRPAGGSWRSPDAIQYLIDNGSQVESRTVSGWWKDTGQLADMLKANRLVLEDLVGGIEGELVSSGSRAGSRCGAAPGSSAPWSAAPRSSARAPGSPAAVGPYTLDRRARDRGRSEVEHSILLADCTVTDLDSRMSEPPGAERQAGSRRRSAADARMIVGDRSEITLP